MTVSDLLLDVLQAHGVRQVFGIPGDAINDIMDSLRRRDDLRFIQVRHEEAGAFAASAQAKLTNRLSACLGTAGPGAIHLLNGLYDAKLDHAPVLAITGQVETGSIGTSYHQEVRLERLFADVASYSQTVVTEEQLPDVFIEACHAAISRRGVAHISLPSDLSGRRVKRGDRRITSSAVVEPSGVPDTALAEAVELIGASKRIAILAGIGCRNAKRELRAFASRICAPIIRSLRAKEIIDDDDPQCIGGLGMLGGTPAVRAIESCDLLLMIGTDFPYRDFYPSGTRVVQIDADATQIGKRLRVDVALVGNAAPVLARLTDLCDENVDRRFVETAQERMKKWLSSQSAIETSDEQPIKSARVMAELAKAAPPNAIFCCDTGTATAWSARHLRLKDEQRYTLSGGLASMGYALPAAIGAQLAYPDRRAFAIAGDGGFAMLMADFLTAVRYDLPIVVLVLNNSKLGFITMEQEVRGLPDYGTGLTNPDFAEIARACGGIGYRVEDPQALESVLAEAMAQGKPTIVDVLVDEDQLFVPSKLAIGDAANYGLAKVREALG